MKMGCGFSICGKKIVNFRKTLSFSKSISDGYLVFQYKVLKCQSMSRQNFVWLR